MFALFAGLLSLAGPASVQAQGSASDEPEFVGINIGFESRYLVGAWTQVDLLVRGGRVPMTVVAQIRNEDGDGVMGTPRECRFLFPRFGPVRGGLERISKPARRASEGFAVIECPALACASG